MIHFDYLRPARPLFLRRVLQARLPAEFVAPLCAVGAAVLIISGAFSIEVGRLSRIAAIEARHRVAYDESTLQLSRTKVIFAGLKRTAAFAEEVRAIQKSGDAQAARFAEIGNRLPPHIWLTAITNDDSGMLLSGKAVNLTMLSRAMSDLSTLKNRYAPTLVSANGDDRAPTRTPVQYQLHLEDATRHQWPQ